MFDYEQFNDLLERTVHKYNQFEKKKKHYADGVEVTQAEIHTIACIGDHPEFNLTKLAAFRGITKSAASQMVYKLRDKGLVTKQVSPDSDAEIRIALTDAGKVAYEAHRDYHANTTGYFFQVMKQIPEETAVQMAEILKQFDVAMDEMIQK